MYLFATSTTPRASTSSRQGPWAIGEESPLEDALGLEVSGISPLPSVAWQVVTFDGASVQSGLTTLPAGETTVQEPIQPLNLASTWLVYTYRVEAAFTLPERPSRDLLARGALNGLDTVTFAREGTTGAVPLAWYAISFENGTEVRSGTTQFATGQTSASVALGGFDPSVSLATAGGLYSRGGSTTYDGADTGEGSVKLELSATGLELSRASSLAEATIDWHVVSFR